MGGFINLIGGESKGATLYFNVVPQLRSGQYSFGQEGLDTAFLATANTTMQVDWGDDTKVTYNLNANVLFSLGDQHTYNNNSIRQVAVKVAEPLLFTEIYLRRGSIQGGLPSQISKFQNLKVLSIWYHNITSVPAVAFNLPKLENLEVRLELITALPDLFSKTPLLKTLDCSYSTRVSTFPATLAMCQALEEINIIRTGLISGFAIPANFSQYTALKRLYTGSADTVPTSMGSTLPLAVCQLPNLALWDMRRQPFTTLQNIQLALNLAELRYGNGGVGGGLFTGDLPTGFQNLTKLKTIIAAGAYNSQSRIDNAINNIHAIVVAQAGVNPGDNGNIWRNVTWNLTGSNAVASVAAKTKTQQLVNTYGWTITLN